MQCGALWRPCRGRTHHRTAYGTRQTGRQTRQASQNRRLDGADGYELYGKKLGIIGLGGIGQTVARIAGALGMNVSAWNSHVPEQVFADLNITPVNDMNELIAGSDVVSIHMPLLDSTKGIVTAGKPRSSETGNHVHQHGPCGNHRTGALLARLQRGDIPAALDVFEHEPLTADDPLCSIPGIILTPHTAWRTDGAYVGITRQVVNPLRHSARARISTSSCE